MSVDVGTAPCGLHMLRFEDVTAHLRHARCRVRAASSRSRWRSAPCVADWAFLRGALDGQHLVDGGGAEPVRLPADGVFSVRFRGFGEAESLSLFGPAARTGT